MGLLEINRGRKFASEYMEIPGNSSLSIEDSVAKAMRQAYQTRKPLTGFQLVDFRASTGHGSEQAW